MEDVPVVLAEKSVSLAIVDSVKFSAHQSQSLGCKCRCSDRLKVKVTLRIRNIRMSYIVESLFDFHFECYKLKALMQRLETVGECGLETISNGILYEDTVTSTK